MGELRRDPVVNRWVIIDSERAEREALFQMELFAPIPASECPLSSFFLPQTNISPVPKYGVKPFLNSSFFRCSNPRIRNPNSGLA
jgi:hypothetical protein